MAETLSNYLWAIVIPAILIVMFYRRHLSRKQKNQREENKAIARTHDLANKCEVRRPFPLRKIS